jgi:hypothetical protein
MRILRSCEQRENCQIAAEPHAMPAVLAKGLNVNDATAVHRSLAR